MKTQFSRRRNALMTKGTALTGVGVIGTCLLLYVISLVFPSLPSLVARPGWYLGASASSATHTLTAYVQDSSTLMKDKEALAFQNEVLQNENRVLRSKLADITHLTDSHSVPTGNILAGVLARPPLSPYDTLIVSLPDHAQVAVGAFVFGPGSVPIGTIEQSSGGTAHVSLFSAPARHTEGWIGEKRLPVTLTGESAGAFSATLARDSGVAVNDIVYIPGPGALPIGLVARIETDPSSTHDVVYIAPHINIFSLTWVLIGSKP